MEKIKRNYFFEFSGMPKAGKTTTIESVRHLYRRWGYNVQVFSGHDRTLGIDKKNQRELNIALALRAVEYIVLKSTQDNSPCIFLLDRGIFDRSVFLQMSYQMKAITKYERDLLIQLLFMQKNCQAIDGLFVFDVETEDSLQREYSKTLAKLPGRVMNYEYLNEFRTTLKNNYDEYSGLFSNRYWINTSLVAQRETGVYIAKEIWKIIGGVENEFPIF